MADDLGREPVPAVAGVSGRCHPTGLLTPASSRKRGKPDKLTVPPRDIAIVKTAAKRAQ
jgi:hypothetical protein